MACSINNEPKEEPVETKLFREALYGLIGTPTQRDRFETIATDLRHVSEDLESLLQSWKQLQEDLWKE